MAFDFEKVREIAERVAASSGLEVVETEFRGGGKARMLRIFIDKPEGVTHDDCSSFSRELGTILDVEDVIPGGSYTLEVSSPGLDRKLSRAEDFERFQGNLIKLTTREAIDGNRHFEGRLERFADGELTIDTEQSKRGKKKAQKGIEFEKKVRVPLSNIEKANLVPEI